MRPRTAAVIRPMEMARQSTTRDPRQQGELITLYRPARCSWTMVRIIATGIHKETRMANVEKISVALTPDLATIVRQAVESGDYASASEVVRDALRDWKLKRALGQETVRELRRLWQEGIDSGPAEPLDMEGIKREARARLAAGETPGS
jgi:antitoxin ParD1/3/4